MRLIVTRHGETEENLAGRVQGHLPGALSFEGIRQAQQLGMQLRDEKIDIVYSSDLRRATDTTREISVYHPDVPVVLLEQLRERYLGDLQGQKISEVSEDTLNTWESTMETKTEVYNRAVSCWHDIRGRHPHACVLVVCHIGIGRAFIAAVLGKAPEEVASIQHLHNASISIFDIDDTGDVRIVCMNSIGHPGEHFGRTRLTDEDVDER